MRQDVIAGQVFEIYSENEIEEAKCVNPLEVHVRIETTCVLCGEPIEPTLADFLEGPVQHNDAFHRI